MLIRKPILIPKMNNEIKVKPKKKKTRDTFNPGL